MPPNGRTDHGREGTVSRMNVTLRYTQLGLAVAALLDKAEPLDAGQAQQYIEDGSLCSWLGQRYDGEIDLSLYEADDQADVLERFQALSDTVDTERTFGIESSGLALLRPIASRSCRKSTTSKSHSQDARRRHRRQPRHRRNGHLTGTRPRSFRPWLATAGPGLPAAGTVDDLQARWRQVRGHGRRAPQGVPAGNGPSWQLHRGPRLAAPSRRSSTSASSSRSTPTSLPMAGPTRPWSGTTRS